MLEKIKLKCQFLGALSIFGIRFVLPHLIRILVFLTIYFLFSLISSADFGSDMLYWSFYILTYPFHFPFSHWDEDYLLSLLIGAIVYGGAIWVFLQRKKKPDFVYFLYYVFILPFSELTYSYMYVRKCFHHLHRSPADLYNISKRYLRTEPILGVDFFSFSPEKRLLLLETDTWIIGKITLLNQRFNEQLEYSSKKHSKMFAPYVEGIEQSQNGTIVWV